MFRRSPVSLCIWFLSYGNVGISQLGRYDHVEATTRPTRFLLTLTSSISTDGLVFRVCRKDQTLSEKERSVTYRFIRTETQLNPGYHENIRCLQCKSHNFTHWHDPHWSVIAACQWSYCQPTLTLCRCRHAGTSSFFDRV